MAELEEILKAAGRARATGQRAVLATVVKVEGSAYRRPGARMLMVEGAEELGSISGGCLEADVMARARTVMADGVPQVVRYDTSRSEDVVWGLGLGCPGIVHILIERVEAGQASDSLCFLESQRAADEPALLCTVIGREHSPVTPGQKVFFAPARGMVGTLGPAIDAFLKVRMLQLLEGPSTILRFSGKNEESVDLFCEVTRPPLPLIIFGAGGDARPLVRLAKELGWVVTLVDHRAAFVTAERFPDADGLVVSPAEEIGTRVQWSHRSVAVVMTHHFLRDLELLRHLLPMRLRYLGLLGRRERAHQLLKTLGEGGVPPNVDELSTLRAPVGIDLGAETPEEIALSIVAEIKSVLSGREGRPLRERIASIHEEDDLGAADLSCPVS